jgi:uncharacterized membrane protein YjjP (DUF1212 family)
MTDLTPCSQVLTFECFYIHWITPVHGFIGSIINQSINQSINLKAVFQVTTGLLTGIYVLDAIACRLVNGHWRVNSY